MNAEIILQESDLSKVDSNSLNTKQLNFLLSKTPANHIYERPAKGGGKWKYVSGTYIRKVLNLMFGWDWSFEIVNEMIQDGEAIVKGRLTVNTNGRTIVKMQYGNKQIMCKRGTKTPLSIGNDLKAAATDSLKKCATELGIASDVYAPNEFKEIKVKTDFIEDIKENDKNVDEMSEKELMQEIRKRLSSNPNSKSISEMLNAKKESGELTEDLLRNTLKDLRDAK